MTLELIALVFSGLSATAAVISAVFAVKAKQYIAQLKIQLNNNNNNKITIKNSGTNSGSIAGISEVNNHGEN